VLTFHRTRFDADNAETEHTRLRRTGRVFAQGHEQAEIEIPALIDKRGAGRVDGADQRIRRIRRAGTAERTLRGAVAVGKIPVGGLRSGRQ